MVQPWSMSQERHTFLLTGSVSYIHVTMLANTYGVVPLVTKWTPAIKSTGVQVCLVNSWTYQTDCNGLFLKKGVTAMAAEDNLWRHPYRFTAPSEIVTNVGSQFLNQRLTYHDEESGIKHNTTIPYSDDKNGLSNRQTRRLTHIRNVLFDKGHFNKWSRLLYMTERF